MVAYQPVGLLCIALLIHARSAERITPYHDVNSAPFPFLVQIMGRDRQICCGTILNNRYIRTAGVCLWAHHETKDFGKVSIVVGVNSDYEKIYEVEKQIEHDYEVSDDTVGLLRTTEEISYHNGHIEPVKLSSKDYDIDGYPVVVYGDLTSRWIGEYHKSGTWMQITKIRDNKQCAADLAGNISDVWMCTWRHRHNEEWHYFHRGSPILADGHQIGITSFVQLDLDTTKIRLSVRIYPYLDWIQTQANLSLPRLNSSTHNHQGSGSVTARISFMFTCVCLYLSWITQ